VPNVYAVAYFASADHWDDIDGAPDDNASAQPAALHPGWGNPSAEDIAIAVRLREGDVTALEAMMTSSYRTLLTYVAHRTASVDTASDILQELFVQVWRRRETFPVDRPILPYLIAAARHRVLDDVRTRKRRTQKLESHPDAYPRMAGTDPATPLHDAEYAEFARAAREAVERLPDRPREIWRMNREEGLSLPEIAAILGISVNTAKTHMMRASAALREALRPFLE